VSVTPFENVRVAKPNNTSPGLFISHKLEADGKLAHYIQDELTSVARQNKGTLDVHISEEIPVGDPWLDGIASRLRASKILLLLFTNPSADWDWCLFEAGFFWGARRRIVCLHDPQHRPPNQLLHLQPLAATEAEVSKFVRELLTTSKYFGGPVISKVKDSNWYDKFGQQVAQQVLGNRSRPLLPRLIIEVKDDRKLKQDAIPGDAKIINPSTDVLRLFGRDSEPDSGLCWKDIQKLATDPVGNPQWLKDLAASIYNAHAGIYTNEPKPSVYRPPGQIKAAFRAEPSRVESYSGNKKRFHVVFVKEPTLTRAVTSFGDLMLQLQELFESSLPGDTINWLAYTPAIGFLARKSMEWKALESVIRKYAERLDIVCLPPKELDSWHRLFQQRATDHGPGLVNDDLILAATRVSQDLLSLNMSSCSFVPFEMLPEYYLFSHPRRAIAVTPFFLPRLNDGNPGDLRQSEKVEMCGLVTQDRVMVDLARKVHTIVQGRRIAGRISSPSKIAGPTSTPQSDSPSVTRERLP